MAKFTLKHEINCNAETFWKWFFDKEFNEKLYKNALEFPEFSVLELKETDDKITRRAAGTPKMNMPGPVAKVLGSNFRYTEDGTFDRSTQTWRWKMTPSTLADKMRNEGTLKLEPIGDGKVRRVTEIVIEAKVFMVGGLLEETAEKQLREGWDKSAVFMNKWLQDHAAG
jgi:hypothetical protein